MPEICPYSVHPYVTLLNRSYMERGKDNLVWAPCAQENTRPKAVDFLVFKNPSFVNLLGEKLPFLSCDFASNHGCLFRSKGNLLLSYDGEHKLFLPT